MLSHSDSVAGHFRSDFSGREYSISDHMSLLGCECARKGVFLPSKQTFRKALRANLDSSSFEETPSLWRNLVKRYSALNFTFESDRLPALSGIVTVFQMVRSSPYFAGFWGDAFILDMLW